MARIEEIELAAHRAELQGDVRRVFNKYLAAFGWDVPGLDEAEAERLILASMRHALDELQQQLAADRA